MNNRDYEKYRRKADGRFAVEPVPLPSGLRDFAVIPAFDEVEELPRCLDSLPENPRSAVMVVVNHPAGATPAQKQASEALLHMLRERRQRNSGLFWIFAPNLTGGVGDARKIGMDAVVRAVDAVSAADTILYSLDADTMVEPAYWMVIRARFGADPKLAALAVGYAHRAGADGAQEAAIRRYESYLTRYVDRLREAGSPYAFHTVGSAFAVRLSAYVRAGGMRIRRGGEDFYFLQAVAKTGRVAEESAVLVHPSPRPSGRVPFGTGPAVRALLSGGELPEISDAAFEALADILRCPPGEYDRLYLPKAPEVIRAFFLREKFDIAWPRIAANTPNRPEALAAAFHLWFDGLKTLRFLHYFDRCAAGQGDSSE